MCKIIDFDAFLGLVLEKQEKVGFRILREMVEYFEESSVVIDFSSATVASALSHYPQIFAVSRENKCYSRAGKFSKIFIEEEFAPMVPDDVKKMIEDILNEKSIKHVGSAH